MDSDFVKKLLGIVTRQDVTTLMLEKDGVRIRIERHALDSALPEVSEHRDTGLKSRPVMAVPLEKTEIQTSSVVKAPMTGIVHLSAKPGAPNFVSVGDKVTKGQQVAIIEAMKTFSPIKAPEAGTVQEIMVLSGAEVDGGFELMRILPSEKES